MTESFKGRKLARFAAVQALYQLEQGESDINQVLGEFVAHRLAKLKKGPVDIALFQGLLAGAHTHQDELDLLIEKFLMEGWRIERLDSVLRAILRAGFFELKYEITTPIGVIINDYVDIAKQFFEGRESAFVNGALDNGAKALRCS